ncbi:MAG: hypothetical protein IJY28_11060 [Clostridia bacterium]|nr:hypothetical protein [Clostridia bacterium]
MYIAISEEMRYAIRFYMGDPAVVRDGKFRGGATAYNTINALLHRGIRNEQDKLREGRVLEIYDRAHLLQYLQIIEAIDRAMDCTDVAAVQTVTWRVDRLSAVRAWTDRSETEGFYSTCKRGFLPAYAHSKADVALMEIVRAPEVPCLDFERLFGPQYAKPEEAEILLPFGAVVQQMEELPLSEAERATFTDRNGNPPRGKFRLCIGVPQAKPAADPTALLAEIASERAVQQARQCLILLRDTGTLPPDALNFYCRWKDAIRSYFDGLRQQRKDMMP